MKFKYNDQTLEINAEDIRELKLEPADDILGYIWSGQSVPLVDGNAHYEIIKEYIKQGGKITPAFSNSEILDRAKTLKIQELDLYEADLPQMTSVIVDKQKFQVRNNSSFRDWLNAKITRHQGTTESIVYDILDDSGSVIAQLPFSGANIKACYDLFSDQAQARYTIYRDTKTKIITAVDDVALNAISVKGSFAAFVGAARIDLTDLQAS